MNTIKCTGLYKQISLAIVLFTACLLLSCATKYAFNTSTVVPAAEGLVKVKKDKNNNYSIALIVKRLAEPELKLISTFHRLRKGVIDEELFDVVAGFEALKTKTN